MTIESLLPTSSNKISSDGLETLTNAWIWFLIVIFALCLLLWLISFFSGLKTLRNHQKILKDVTRDTLEENRSEIFSPKFPWHLNWESTLLTVGEGRETKLFQTLPPEQVYPSNKLLGWHAPITSFSRSIPAILIAAGILGTFVGLTLGLDSISSSGEAASDTDTELENKIQNLISGCTTAFKTSVWGVGLSLLATALLKAGEIFCKERSLERFYNKINSLLPHWTPETALNNLANSSAQSELTLKTLSQEIGAQMQTAVKELGAELSKTFAEQNGEHSAKAGEQLKEGLATELHKITETIDGLKQTVNAAVEALQGQKEVVDGFDKAAEKVGEGAQKLESFKNTLSSATSQNLEAAQAQKSAAEKNEEVAEKLEKVSQGLPKIEDSIGKSESSTTDLKMQITKLTDSLAGSEASGASGVLSAIQGLATQMESLKYLVPGIQSAADTLTESAATLNKFKTGLIDSTRTQERAAKATQEAVEKSGLVIESLQPLPAQIQLASTSIESASSNLISAGSATKEGADSMVTALREIAQAQGSWNLGIEIGLKGLNEQLNNIITQYGDSIDRQTKELLQVWSQEVQTTIGRFATVSEELGEQIDDLNSRLNS